MEETLMKNTRTIACSLFILILLTFFFGCATTPDKKSSRGIEIETLIGTLHQSRNETLYYDESTYPKNVNQIIDDKNIINPLVSAYHADTNDDLFRFNIIMILNKKLRSHVSDKEKDLIGNCLLESLKDSSPWVKTEAVWGLGFIAEKKFVPMIMPLLDDKDDNVVNEAILTLTKINGLGGEMVSNQTATKDEREAGINYWKGWWKENRDRFEK
jgi:hypothetical protein